MSDETKITNPEVEVTEVTEVTEEATKCVDPVLEKLKEYGGGLETYNEVQKFGVGTVDDLAILTEDDLVGIGSILFFRNVGETFEIRTAVQDLCDLQMHAGRFFDRCGVHFKGNICSGTDVADAEHTYFDCFHDGAFLKHI